MGRERACFAVCRERHGDRTAFKKQCCKPECGQDRNLMRPPGWLRTGETRRAIPVILGMLTLGLAAVLLFSDACPSLFPPKAHAVLEALPLSLIAFAYLVYQAGRRPSRMELAKAGLLAVAFLFWSANQLWPELSAATLFDDIAIVLFVLDVFLVIVGWPPSILDASSRGTPARDAGWT